MSGTTIVILGVIVVLAVKGWILWRQRVNEEEEDDAAYRRDVLRRNKTKPMSEDEEDYILRLRAGRKAKSPRNGVGAPEDPST